MDNSLHLHQVGLGRVFPMSAKYRCDIGIVQVIWRLACQLLNESESSCKTWTERDIMETPISSDSIEFSDIHCDNGVYHAAVCQRCGAKMYPVELLEAHMDRHQLKDLYLEGELKRLQYAMGRMR